MIFRRPPKPNPVADELRAQLAAERVRTAELMETIVEMKRDGFQMPAPPGEPMTDEGFGLPADVADAIEQRAFNRQSMERLSQEARRLLRQADSGEVAEMILAGDEFTWS